MDLKNTNSTLTRQKNLTYTKEEDLPEENGEQINFEDHMQVVSFLVGNEEYAIEILFIHEINRITQITPVPNTPTFIRGIMNLRGNVIPVVDLREKFGLSPKEFDEESRIIVVEMEEKLVAIIVDSVYQTLRIRKNDVELAADMITGISGNYIKGVAKYKDRLVILLKLSQVLLENEEEAYSGEEGEG